jgi:aspartyl-tRNA(Asn)/glutamyl-tRNA(Gln) amidotransferase subunit B
LLSSPAFSRIDDEIYILKIAVETLDENPGALTDYISGKQNARTFLIGQCMRKTKGRANPRVLSRILDGELRKRKAEIR